MPEEEYLEIEPIDLNEWFNHLNELQARYDSLKSIMSAEESNNIKLDINKLHGNIHSLIKTFIDIGNTSKSITKDLNKITMRHFNS